MPDALRGPQTVGELRGRTERLYKFDDLEAVEATLTRLMERQPEPLAMRMARQTGSKRCGSRICWGASLKCRRLRPSKQQYPT